MTFNSISQKDKVSPSLTLHLPPLSIAEVSVACVCREYSCSKPLQVGTPTTSNCSHRGTPSCQAVPSYEQVLSTVVVQQSYATQSVSADLHGTGKVRGTGRHLSLKDAEPGKTDTFPIVGYGR